MIEIQVEFFFVFGIKKKVILVLASCIYYYNKKMFLITISKHNNYNLKQSKFKFFKIIAFLRSRPAMLDKNICLSFVLNHI